MPERISTYSEFWKFYVSQHSRSSTRICHYIGVGFVLALIAAAIVDSPKWLLAAPIVGYGPAWFGHWVFEKNRPATFAYPLWSLLSDFLMFGCMLAGRMRVEAEKHRPQI